MIGTIFRLKRECLMNPAGSIGYVFNQYPDFETGDSGGVGVQVIFQNGDYCGYSVEEQKLCFEKIAFSMNLDILEYEFQNVMQVSRDHERGFWFPEAKRSRH